MRREEVMERGLACFFLRRPAGFSFSGSTTLVFSTGTNVAGGRLDFLSLVVPL